MTSVSYPPLRLPGGRVLELSERPLLMGIVNITPDSFSDGGRFLEAERAVEHALRLADEGAHLLDLGAESTRPGGGVYGSGALEVSPTEESDRLLPVLESLRAETALPLSVDTRKAAVARAALRAGADLVNDVGGLRDPELGSVVAAAGCPLVLMHSRGELSDMQREIDFRDVVAEVSRELGELCDLAERCGIAREQLVVDPGIGFGKTREQNLALVRALDRIARDCGRPVLLGASRKSFLSSAPPSERIGGSLAAAEWAARTGTALLRVHDVAATRQFLEVRDAIDSAVADS